MLKSRKNGSITTQYASIISVETLKDGKKPLLELLLLFQNFSGYHIHRKIRVWDSKPNLGRFLPDKTIPIGLNVARKPKDPLFLSQQLYRFSFILVIIWASNLVVYVTGCYILVGEALKRIMDAPKKYEAIFKTSHSWEIGLVFIGVSVIMYLLLQKIGVLANGKTMIQNWNLLYYGIRSRATVTEHTTIKALNKKRLVAQLSYVFKDYTGRQVIGCDKKVLETKEAFCPAEIPELEIMYLPNDSYTSRIVENLESNNFSRFLNIIFMIVVFVFSVVYVIKFYQTVFDT